MSFDGSVSNKKASIEKIVTLDTPLTNGSPVRTEMELTAVGGLADIAPFRELADMLFMPSQVLQPHERAYLIDMIKVALPALARQERLQFARRLAKMGDSAKPLLPVLFRDDDLEVASAILSSSIVLADDALVDLVQSAEPERLMVIAGRPDLSTSVTSAILYTEDIPAIFESLKNSRARFSPQILAECVQLAEEFPILRSPLMQRSEITPAVALDLFWMMEHKGRTAILFRHLADDLYLNKTSLTKSSAALRQRDQARQTDAAGASDLEQLDAYISIGEIDKAVPILVRSAGLRDILATQILSDLGGEPLAVLYKHAGARRSHFQNLCENIRHLGLSPLAENADFEAISILFDRLSRGQAHMAITYWDWRAAGIGPYAAQGGEAAFNESERSQKKSITTRPQLYIHEIKCSEPLEEKAGKAGFGKRAQTIKSVTVDDENPQDKTALKPNEIEVEIEKTPMAGLECQPGSHMEKNELQEKNSVAIMQVDDDDLELRPKKQIAPAPREDATQPALDLRKLPQFGRASGYLSEID